MALIQLLNEENISLTLYWHAISLEMSVFTGVFHISLEFEAAAMDVSDFHGFTRFLGAQNGSQESLCRQSHV